MVSQVKWTKSKMARNYPDSLITSKSTINGWWYQPDWTEINRNGDRSWWSVKESAVQRKLLNSLRSRQWKCMVLYISLDTRTTIAPNRQVTTISGRHIIQNINLNILENVNECVILADENQKLIRWMHLRKKKKRPFGKSWRKQILTILYTTKSFGYTNYECMPLFKTPLLETTYRKIRYWIDNDLICGF